MTVPAKLSCDRESPASDTARDGMAGAGRLTRLLLIGYLLPLLTVMTLAALHSLPASSHPRFAANIDLSRATLRMLLVPVCFGPAFILTLLGLWSSCRENHADAAAHARALLASLLYGVDACLLWIFSAEVDPGPPAYYGDLFQVLDFLFLAPARLFSRLCHWGAILLGGWAVVRAIMGGMALLQQKNPGWLVRRGMASFLSGYGCLALPSACSGPSYERPTRRKPVRREALCRRTRYGERIRTGKHPSIPPPCPCLALVLASANMFRLR